MKYRKRSIICSLLAGLTALISSCAKDEPSFELLASKQIDFPSASAIEFYNNQLFVFGDDAPLLLVLSTKYDLLDTVRLVSDSNRRIPKDEKPDIESATIVNKNNEPVLYGFGSLSGEERWAVFEYNLQSKVVRQAVFFPVTTNFPDVKEINIEGSCAIDNNLLFANRANLSNPVNHLLQRRPDGVVVTKKLTLPSNKIVAGVSGLYYLKEKDILFFTASEEGTASSYEDGEIGDSYLGWIHNFSSKINGTECSADQFVKLATVDKAFDKQKIESVCVEKVNGNRIVLHLVADNDRGDSNLFKLKLTL